MGKADGHKRDPDHDPRIKVGERDTRFVDTFGHAVSADMIH